jgi:hypothetical protein
MKDKYGYSRVGYTDFLMNYEKKEHHSNLVRWLVDLTNCQDYLEIGVENGDCVYNVRDYVKRCVAVDVVDKMTDKKDIEFFHMKSDEFFEKNIDTFDIIFIDGDHDYEQVRKDFENAIKILNELGIIIMHDTDPIHFGLIHPAYCNDAYKIVEYIENEHPELNIITLPIHEAGLSIIMKKGERRVDRSWPKGRWK